MRRAKNAPRGLHSLLAGEIIAVAGKGLSALQVAFSVAIIVSGRVPANQRVQPTAISSVLRRKAWLNPVSVGAAADAQGVRRRINEPISPPPQLLGVSFLTKSC